MILQIWQNNQEYNIQIYCVLTYVKHVVTAGNTLYL